MQSPAIRIHTNIPSPYRQHQFEMIAKVFPDTKVFFYTKMEPGRAWAFEFKDWRVCCLRMNDKIRVKGIGVLHFGRLGMLSKIFLKDIFSCKKGTVHLIGYGVSGLEWWILWSLGVMGWAKIVQHSDGALLERTAAATWWRKFRNLGCAYCYIPGKQGRLAALKMGFKPLCIYNAYFSHDVELFDAYYRANKDMQKMKIRQIYGIETPYVLLTISRFLDWKRLPDLAEALYRLEKKNIELAKKITFILIGDGDDQEHFKILQQIRAIRVLHLKQMPYLEVLPYYCTADLFVLPSEGDIWGLVVNEALSMRVPVICTHRIGAAELIKNDVNGFVVPPRDVELLMHAIEKVLENESRLQKMKMGAGQIVTSWRTEFGVRELLKLAHS